ncbi:MAG: glutathione S-transferase family protein [Stenotrophobium sp.]
MALVLYAHPFASYCQKVLIALYENGTGFTFRMLDDEKGFAELEALWPHKKFPVLVDGDATLIESSVIIEYLMLHYLGPVQLIPENPEAALHTRFMDRFFDNYVMTPMQKVVGDSLRVPANRDPVGVAAAKTELDISYRWLDSAMQNRTWAAGENFSLADCAAAPSLFYADWVHEIAQQFVNVRAYRARLLARPSIVRVVNEARPYRNLFPLGAPDRD